ncbi:MAG: hypothetical protein IKD33_05615, partial [Bacteroidales bacterium]|nr:hypothetical protein [Bacteroidales bacterium]
DSDRIFSVKQTMTRKYDIIDTLQFVVDAEGLPMPVSQAISHAVAKSAASALSYTPQSVGNYNAEEVFTSVMQEGEKLRAYELQSRVMERYKSITLNGYLYIKDMAQRIGLLCKTVINPRCVYYSLQPTLRATIATTTAGTASNSRFASSP